MLWLLGSGLASSAVDSPTGHVAVESSQVLGCRCSHHRSQPLRTLSLFRLKLIFF